MKIPIIALLICLAPFCLSATAQEMVVPRSESGLTTGTIRRNEMPPEPPPPPVENPDAIKPPEELDSEVSQTALTENPAERPPLGIGDLMAHLDSAVALLDDKPSSAALRRQDAPINIHLDYVKDYLTHTLQTRYSDLDYEWAYMGRESIYPKPAQYQAFDENKIFRGITALRFSANPRQGKVYVSQVTVYGEEKNNVRYYPFNRWIVPDLPRYEYLYLGEPMDVRRVEVISYHEGEGKRRLYLDTGKPTRPDYPRQALYHIERAKHFIDTNRTDSLIQELNKTLLVISALNNSENTTAKAPSALR